jgi:hypothetical protein
MSIHTLDCSDIDRHLGKPIEGARLKDPIGNMDIKRWVQAMHYPNGLHYNHAYSFAVACDDGHGSAPACVGRIAESHLLFGGDEWWFHGPRISAGDMIHNERIPFDYVVKETKFAGPTCFQRGDNHYYNQRGEKLATQRSTSIRYLASAAREASRGAASEDPEWSDAQLVELEEKKFEYIKMLHDLGHGKRYWDDVKLGDKLPTRVIGPHSVASFATEWRAYIFTTWGGMRRRTDIDLAALGFTTEMAGKESDLELEKLNPEQTDGAYIGPSRGHLFPRWARYIGMLRVRRVDGRLVSRLPCGLGRRVGHGRALELCVPGTCIHGRRDHSQRARGRQAGRRGEARHRAGRLQDDESDQRYARDR